MNSLDLTVVILTLNEEDRIAKALNSIQMPARVVILDSFSKDQTIERAHQAWRDSRRPTEELVSVQREWLGFTLTRNASLEWVQTPWVFWLDADEWMSPQLCKELSNLESLDPKSAIFRIPRQSYFLGRAIRHGGWYPDRKSRLARSARVEWRAGPGGADVHEDIYEKGVVDKTRERPVLAGHIYHQSFRDQEEQEETNRRYSTLLAQGLAQTLATQRKKPPGLLKIYIKSAVKFVENYILKLGFLDGWPGFVIARGSAYSLYMRFTKTRELMK